MVYKNCLENLMNVTQYNEYALRKYLKNTTTKCAGSFPTNIGINACKVQTVIDSLATNVSKCACGI